MFALDEAAAAPPPLWPHFVACCDKSCRTICWLPRPCPLPRLRIQRAHLKLSGKKYGWTFYLLWSIFCVLTHTHTHTHLPVLQEEEGEGDWEWDWDRAMISFVVVAIVVVVICLDFLLFICCIKQNKSNLIYSCTPTHTHTMAHHVGVWQLTVPDPLLPLSSTGCFFLLSLWIILPRLELIRRQFLGLCILKWCKL